MTPWKHVEAQWFTYRGGTLGGAYGQDGESHHTPCHPTTLPTPPLHPHLTPTLHSSPKLPSPQRVLLPGTPFSFRTPLYLPRTLPSPGTSVLPSTTTPQDPYLPSTSPPQDPFLPRALPSPSTRVTQYQPSPGPFPPLWLLQLSSPEPFPPMVLAPFSTSPPQDSLLPCGCSGLPLAQPPHVTRRQP